MTTVSDLFPSKYLKATDLQGHEVETTIECLSMEVLDGDECPVLYFDGKKKGLVINRTNANTIAKLHGQNTDDWKGMSITLDPTETTFKGETVACIRVRSGTVVKSADEPDGF